jgi:chemotaxis protein MotB
MRRRSHEATHENHERWLVSYADFITLLFAFFVVMFATSQTDKRKVNAAEQSVRRAFGAEQVNSKVAKILGGTVDDLGQGNRMMRGPGGANVAVAVPPKDRTELLPSLDYLTKELAEEIDKGRLTIHMEQRGLVVSMHEGAYFVSGDDGLSPPVAKVLSAIASTIEDLPNPLRLEGHTDAVPIHNSRFRSNWELSSARGIAVLEALKTRFGVPENRMAVVGYADSFPLDTNDTPEGRGRNRRVDIVILNRAGVMANPGPVEQGK